MGAHLAQIRVVADVVAGAVLVDVAELDRLADLDRAAVRLDDAHENIDKRALARAILAMEADEAGAGPEIEVRVVAEVGKGQPGEHVLTDGVMHDRTRVVDTTVGRALLQ